MTSIPNAYGRMKRTPIFLLPYLSMTITIRMDLINEQKVIMISLLTPMIESSRYCQNRIFASRKS